jgi:hypothetical protein
MSTVCGVQPYKQQDLRKGKSRMSVYDMSVVLVATHQHVMTDKWTNIDTIWYYQY